MSTMYSIGAMNQLADALENAGFTPDEITKLKQFKDLEAIKAVINGRASIIFPEKKWYEVDGMIYIKVISDGTTGEQWIVRLEKKGFKLSKWAKDLLLSKDFNPTTGIVYTIAVLKGSLFTDSNRVTKKIRSEAAKRKLVTPNPEVACLIREMFTDYEIEAMGISWIVTFHKPIKDSDGDLSLLYTFRYDDGSWLSTHYDNPGSSWHSGYGFAFEVSQVSL